MKIYAGTTEQFRADARMHRIAEKLRAEYTTQIGHRPAPSEVASWQNSLMALSMLVDQAELNDHGVILEYQLGNTSRRLDAMLTGHPPPAPRTRSSSSASSGATAPSARRPPTTASSWPSVTGSGASSTHRSRSAATQQWLLDNHSVFYETDAVALAAVSYLHNHPYDPAGELWSDRDARGLHRSSVHTCDEPDTVKSARSDTSNAAT